MYTCGARREMENEFPTTVLITGPPGIGKTTLIRKLCDELSKSSTICCHGFYTAEVRNEGRQRIGFDVIDLQSNRNILAREYTKDGVRRPKVGKYSVFLDEFESIALGAMEPPKDSEDSRKLLVLDEIGKMELMSKRFEGALQALLADHVPLLATVPSQSRQPMPIVERLKASPSSRIFQITQSNRNGIIKDILLCVQQLMHK